MNYLREKIESINGDLCVLDSNIELIEMQTENLERLKHVARKMNMIVKYLGINLNYTEDEE